MPAIAPTSTPTTTATSIAAEADRERDAAAIEQARQQVLAEIVGAERMRPATGPASLAAKSISLIGTRQTSGPNATASTISQQDDRRSPRPADAGGSAATPRGPARSARLRARPRAAAGRAGAAQR